MSDEKAPNRHGLMDSVATLRKLRDQLEANISTLSHPSLDARARRVIVDIHRSLLMMADTSKEAKRALEILNSLTIAEIITRHILPMEPEILLADLDTIVELTDNLTKDPKEAVVTSDMPFPAVVPMRKKRGRPSKIPHERKLEALDAKAAGKPNSVVATILYGIRYPSKTQIKGVTAILKHFQKSNSPAPTSVINP